MTKHFSTNDMVDPLGEINGVRTVPRQTFPRQQIENVSAEVTALKSFIIEQLYVVKKSMEDFRSENFAPNNLELIETLKEEIRYLRKKI